MSPTHRPTPSPPPCHPSSRPSVAASLSPPDPKVPSTGIDDRYPIIASPHLIRPFTSRQVSLVEGSGEVVVFGVVDGRSVGSSVMVHGPTLARRVRELGPDVSIVVVIDQPVPDATTMAVVDDMIADFAAREVDVLARAAPVTEAIKRIEGDTVRCGVDRSALVVLRCPEVIARRAMEAGVELIGDRNWVNPAALAAAAGAMVAPFDPGGAGPT